MASAIARGMEDHSKVLTIVHTGQVSPQARRDAVRTRPFQTLTGDPTIRIVVERTQPARFMQARIIRDSLTFAFPNPESPHAKVQSP